MDDITTRDIKQLSKKEPITDKTIMWFGKHKGLHMARIPSSYFEWLVEQDFTKEKYPELYEYALERAEELDTAGYYDSEDMFWEEDD